MTDTTSNTDTTDLIEADPCIKQARKKAFILYEGREVPHRSCGISIAETFGRATQPYQALRKGGLTGLGECGAIKAGELVLGEFLGDPEPSGGVTPALREAALRYRALWEERLFAKKESDLEHPCIACHHLTAPFEDFRGEARKNFCTRLATQVAHSVAEVLVEAKSDFSIEPIVQAEDEC